MEDQHVSTSATNQPLEPETVRRRAMRSMDIAAKQILSHAPLLALIMQNTIAEYRACTIEEIIDTIKPNIQVGNMPVDDRSVRSPLGFGLRNEDNSSEDGSLHYDILFGARIPNRSEEIGLIINIEPQANPNPGYPLLKRAQYYCARMLSAQRANWDSGSDYSRLKKVYSIWLCTNPPRGLEDTITVYSMAEHMVQGRGWRDPSEYDLQSIVMVCLPKPGEYTVFTEALATILSPVTGVDAKMKALETHLGDELAQDFKDEVADMDGIGEYAVNIGIEKGIEQGRAIGLEIGLQQGLEQGLEQGRELGAEQATVASVASLMETLGLNLEQAMDALKIPSEKRAYYQELLKA